MAILHDAIKTLQNGVFVFRTKTRFFSKNPKYPDLKKRAGLFFLKRRFFSNMLIFNHFLWFSLDRTIWNKSRHYHFD